LRIYLFALTNANSHVIAHAVQCAGEDDVVGAATVDEYFGQADLADHRADHKEVSTRPGQWTQWSRWSEVIGVSDHRRGSTRCLNTKLNSRSSSLSLRRHDGLLGPPNMKLTALSSSWKFPVKSSLCSSSSRLGELRLRWHARVVLEPLGLSRSSRRGRVGEKTSPSSRGEQLKRVNYS